MQRTATFITPLGLVLMMSTAGFGSTADQAPAKPAAKPAAQPPAKTATADVVVTASYTGKGPVDATHQIFVFLFDNPNMGAHSRPLAVQEVIKNGGVAKFSGVTTSPVYVALAYDEKGDYDGTNAAPPPGTPIGAYSTDAKGPPAPVTPGPKGKVKATFDGSRRM